MAKCLNIFILILVVFMFIQNLRIDKHVIDINQSFNGNITGMNDLIAEFNKTLTIIHTDTKVGVFFSLVNVALTIFFVVLLSLPEKESKGFIKLHMYTSSDCFQTIYFPCETNLWDFKSIYCRYNNLIVSNTTFKSLDKAINYEWSKNDKLSVLFFDNQNIFVETC
jgi:hypothetical protein